MGVLSEFVGHLGNSRKRNFIRRMDKFVIGFLLLCSVILASASELSIHDYDIQIHPIHGHHHGYHGDDGEHGYATSIRYDKRYHHKVPVHDYHEEDVVYQYVSDGHHDDEDDEGHHVYHGY